MEETRKESTDAKDIKSGGTKKNQDSKDTKESKKIKKSKPISRAPIATGISTEIEVTGEKPKPIQEGDPSLEDDVLYAIFVILYEEDLTEKGMTVKHITDVLDEKYPQFTKNTGKVSNLVSAKINSYIKRLEAGQTSLRYAISRDWGTNTPKRMLYRYRGILAPGWEVKLKELQKQQESKQQQQQEQQSEEQQNEQQSDDSQESNWNNNTNNKMNQRKNQDHQILNLLNHVRKFLELNQYQQISKIILPNLINNKINFRCHCQQQQLQLQLQLLKQPQREELPCLI